MSEALNQLLNDHLPQPDPDAYGPRTRWHDLEDMGQKAAEVFDYHVMHPGHRLLRLPEQVLSRYVDPQGTSRFWRPLGVGERKMQEFSPAAEAIGNQLMAIGYQPGERESKNAVVDYGLGLNPFDLLEQRR